MEFDRVSRGFDEIVYGRRPPSAADVQAARADWRVILDRARPAETKKRNGHRPASRVPEPRKPEDIPAAEPKVPPAAEVPSVMFAILRSIGRP